MFGLGGKGKLPRIPQFPWFPRNFRGFRVIDLAQFYVINDLKKLIFSQQGIIRTNQNLSESLPSNRMLCYMNIVP